MVNVKNNNLKFIHMRLLLSLVVGLVLAMASTDAHGFWKFRSKKATEEAMNEISQIIYAADTYWRNGKGDEAVELYQRAIDELKEMESGQSEKEVGVIRFRRAYCETQIDQIKFALATKTERRVTITSEPAVAERPAAVDKPPVAAAEKPQTTEDPDKVETTGSQATTVQPETVVESRQPLPAGSANIVASQPPVADVAAELAWARDMVGMDRLDEAAATLIRILKGEPGNRSARLMLASIRCRQGAFGDALIILEDLRAERENEALLMTIAGAYCGSTRYYEAMLTLDKILSKNPRHADANMNMAYLLLEMSATRQPEAEMYYRQAVKWGATRDLIFERRLGF